MLDFRPWVFGKQKINKGYAITITISFRKFTFLNFVRNNLKFSWGKNKSNHSLVCRDYCTMNIVSCKINMTLFIQHAQAPEALGV